MRLRVAHAKLIDQGVFASDDVRAFCRKHGIVSLVRRAVNLAKEYFQPEEIKIQVEGDPESKEQWVVLLVAVKGDVDHVLDCYQEYKRRWNTVGSWRKRGHVRLVYQFAANSRKVVLTAGARQ